MRTVFKKLRNIWKIFSNPVPLEGSQNKDLLFSYLGLLFRHLIFDSIFQQQRTKENFLGYTFHFFNFSSFISVFEEIFIDHPYFFLPERSEPTIIDCGANIGEEILYFKWLFPHCHITAFEPDKQAFALLKKNIEENNLENVTILNFAVSDQPGKQKLYMEKSNPGALSMSLLKERLNKDSIFIETVKLSSYITKSLDYLKMDIEGVELSVIKEIKKEDRLKKVKNLGLEFHHHISPRDDQLGELLSLLEENGFSYQITTPLQTPFSHGEFQDIFIGAHQ